MDGIRSQQQSREPILADHEPSPSSETTSDPSSLRPNQAKSGSFQCQLCGRVYERVDHLSRHVKSHENLRLHSCPQCPRRFNRADLLRRHRASHDRPYAPKPRRDILPPQTSRRKRVAAACLACIASKSKCQDERPCTRCRHRQIECISSSSATAPDARSDDLDNSSHGHDISPPQNVPQQFSQHYLPGSDNMDDTMASSNQAPNSIEQLQSHDLMPGLHHDVHAAHNLDRPFEAFDDFQLSYFEGDAQFGHGLSFMPRDAYIGQDLDMGVWDFDLEGIELAYHGLEHVQQAQVPARPAAMDQTNASKTLQGRSAPFGQSTLSSSPMESNQALNEQSSIHLDEENIPSILTPSSPAVKTDEFACCLTNAAKRDKLVGILYTLRRDVVHFPSLLPLPDLPLLNKIIQVYFTTARYWVDHMVHAASFDGSKALSQLLLAIIAAGSTLVSAPAFWKMGLALQEVVMHTASEFWIQNSGNTCDLESLQAFVISLDIGLWSGFKRKMEIAESFRQPVIAALRRAGVFGGSRLSSTSSPLMSDSEEVVNSKWMDWVERESLKRLALHVFVHDVFASVGLQNPPLISFTELKFELPASENLWLAKSAFEWREKYIAAHASKNDVPRFMKAMQNPRILTQYSQRINVHLSALIILHGFWGQIHGLLDAKKYHSQGSSTHQLSVLATGNELYQDLSRFASCLPELTNSASDAIMLSQLFLMIFHANLEDLQRFDGRFGDAEVTDAQAKFEIWAKTKEARIAIWHAAQVIRSAKNLLPNALMAFNAIAVYYATLTLWIYGLMAPHSSFPPPAHSTGREIVLNESDSPEVLAFREYETGIPGVVFIGPDGREFIPLRAAGQILQFARRLFKDNYPVEEEPLPPLVEGMCDLLKELENFPGSRVSRPHSESSR